MTEPIPTRNEAYQTRHLANIPSLSFKRNFFKNTFFPSTTLEWNKLDPSLRNSTSYNVFKNSILKCPLFHTERSSLLNNINEIDSTIFNKSDSVVTRILLYGSKSFNDEVNLLILNATIDFALSTNTFDEPFYLL